jgi:hypothetical protein
MMAAPYRTYGLIAVAYVAALAAEGGAYAVDVSWGQSMLFGVAITIFGCSWMLGPTLHQATIVVALLAGFGLAAFSWGLHWEYLLWLRLEIFESGDVSVDWRAISTFYETLGVFLKIGCACACATSFLTRRRVTSVSATI